jgi:hypothetical protein
MTREEVKNLLPVMQAFAEGKEIQYVNSEGRVLDKVTMFDGVSYAFRYRIKSEPKYRPFKNLEECWNEMQKHQPIGWTKLKGEIEYRFITGVNDNINYLSAIEEYTFADGTPFGIKE